ncbi:unnamed protein product [Lasius platythorax]|uniref:Uncharacterized protein n=1 Tax=Lasius platythorax TaxID=488582 RepID=A0AAV2P9P0_9HYME
MTPKQSGLTYSFYRCILKSTFAASNQLAWPLEDRWTAGSALSARKHQQVVHCDRSRLEPLFSRLPDLNSISTTRNENDNEGRERAGIGELIPMPPLFVHRT